MKSIKITVLALALASMSMPAQAAFDRGALLAGFGLGVAASVVCGSLFKTSQKRARVESQAPIIAEVVPVVQPASMVVANALPVGQATADSVVARATSPQMASYRAIFAFLNPVLANNGDLSHIDSLDRALASGFSNRFDTDLAGARQIELGDDSESSRFLKLLNSRKSSLVGYDQHQSVQVLFPALIKAIDSAAQEHANRRYAEGFAQGCFKALEIAQPKSSQWASVFYLNAQSILQESTPGLDWNVNGKTDRVKELYSDTFQSMLAASRRTQAPVPSPCPAPVPAPVPAPAPAKIPVSGGAGGGFGVTPMAVPLTSEEMSAEAQALVETEVVRAMRVAQQEREARRQAAAQQSPLSDHK